MHVIGVLAAALVGALLLRLASVQGGFVIGAMLGAAAYTLATGGGPYEPSPVLQDAAFVVLGAVIGAGVTRSVVGDLRRFVVPALLAAALIIAAGIGIALLLRAWGMAPPGDVLATSPGALASVVAVAVERDEGATEVALFHTIRIVLVLASLPLLVTLLPRPG